MATQPTDDACKKAKIIAISIAILFIFCEFGAFLLHFQYIGTQPTFIIFLAIGILLEVLSILAVPSGKKYFLLVALGYASLTLLLFLSSFVGFLFTAEKVIKEVFIEPTELEVFGIFVVAVFLEILTFAVHIIRFISIGIVYSWTRNKDERYKAERATLLKA